MQALQRQLAEIRRRGFAVTREELEVGLNGVAAPVRGADRRVIAALGISGPTARLGRNLDQMGRLMITYGDELSRQLQRRVLTEGVA
jgi:DNA-binding IclR family transcriptional regulator